MTHWEFSHIPFDGDLTDDKIVCQNCGWSWKVKDGGDDLYVCHKCNADNSNFYNANFEGADYSQAITQGISAVGSIGSSVAQNKASKEAGKTVTQREIDTICGKDKSKSWIKKKKEAYLSCKNSVLQKLDTDKKTFEQNKKVQQQMMFQRSKEQKNQTYLIIGVIALILGVVIYKKMIK
jgi:hypothetical protein